jgi:hypothetical protein
MSDYDREKAERMRAAFPARTPEAATKHRARAVEQLALHRCSTDLTDGFCCPRDGRCARGASIGRPDRDCMRQAEGLMQAVESRGCTVVWAFDQSMQGG